VATTNRAAAYSPVLAEVLPAAEHLTGKAVQQRIERDHQHLKEDSACSASARRRTGLTCSAELMDLCATFTKASAGSGRSHGIRTTPHRPRLVRLWEEL